MSDVLVEKVRLAQTYLEEIANYTPVYTSNRLNTLVGAQVHLKLENFQKTHSFKFRGAFNAVKQLAGAKRFGGIVAYSSGNHAQAVGLTAQMLGIRATVVVPKDIPVVKRTAIAQYGVTIIDFDPATESREAITQALAEELGYTNVPPSDDLNVIAGAGTVALELFEEVKGLDMLLAPCGGGGLMCGSAIAALVAMPNCKVIGVEPELADDATRSFYTKTLQTVRNPQTIADGTRTQSLGQHTFPLMLKYVSSMTTVSETAIMDAVRFAFFELKQVVEPSGALGLAALLSGKLQPTGRVGVLISGGNIDPSIMTMILNSKGGDLYEHTNACGN